MITNGVLMLVVAVMLLARGLMRTFNPRVIYPLMLIALTAIPAYYLDARRPHSLLTDLWVATATAALVGPAFAFVGCVQTVTKRLKNAPVTIAAISILDAIDCLHYGDSLLTNLDVRNRIISDLGIAAVGIERIPARLVTHDEATDAMFATFAQRAAAAIRSLYRWVLTPQDQTSEDLKQRLISDYLLILQGRWGALPQCDHFSEPDDIKAELGAAGRVKNFALGALSSLSLLITVLLLHRLGFLSEVKHYEWAVLSASAWACFYVIWVCDPQLPTRLAAIKAALELLPLIGKKKG